VLGAAVAGGAFGGRGRGGHARDVYGEVTTTPFVLGLPFRLEPGIVVQAPTENVDVWPTLLDLLGLPPLEGADGRSRVPEILAAARGEAGAVRDGPRLAPIDQTWGMTGGRAPPVVALSGGPHRAGPSPPPGGGGGYAPAGGPR